ncbi:hypothetical protein [Actinoplanes sp. NPDC051411]|uniref:hypothetical protein n=1 Tax=Actinoplanes sp. NPDC051411 TaxID=3155522 RepID=UPI003428D312
MPVPQQPIDLGITSPSPPPVIEFGSEPESAPVRRRRSLSGFGRELLGDRRLVPIGAALAAVAAFASLISEWQVTTVDAAALGNGELGDKVLPTDLADLGAFGGAYLTGLFLLVAAIVLTLFGPPAGRRYARLAGLGVGGAVLGVVLSLTSLLGDQSRLFSRLYTLELNSDQLKVAYGRGLWCALIAVMLAVAALYLAGRDSSSAHWEWRRAVDDQDDDEETFDLTVTSTTPFTSRADDHDRPDR